MPLSELFQRPRRLSWLISWSYCLAVVFTMVGVVLRLTVKDSLAWLAPVYYATPLVLLTAGASYCLVRDLFAGRGARVLVWGILLAFLIPAWFRNDIRFAPRFPSAASSETIDVLFWNIARRGDMRAAADYLREADPDLVGLVEAGTDGSAAHDFWNKELPEYQVSTLGASMQILAKGTSGYAEPREIGKGSLSRRLTVTFHGVEYECFVVDVGANLDWPREHPLTKLKELTEPYEDKPVIVMGDFNTPSDSVWFGPLRKDYQLAFEAAGRGYAPTWPLPLPVLHIDHIWINNQLEALSCRHGWSSASDHRPVHATIRLRRKE